ncbi:hypothetical protein Dtox_3526 [Desulfofarcimen acetoxidans DSM 771]|uniref:Uncharacterized protein n=1 Tax=Desulfofarcimen acetoxidans (strain ATCC 49208 / DSM 771 / KCTC 5769 / VKM B-1644 / 5575) TaxID=485916 RepID=C8VVV6_DESAS|nr:hypothetical protein Dtox_3526 [Desulfofarcimen acetoxidans DSM 771]
MVPILFKVNPGTILFLFHLFWWFYLSIIIKRTLAVRVELINIVSLVVYLLGGMFLYYDKSPY